VHGAIVHDDELLFWVPSKNKTFGKTRVHLLKWDDWDEMDDWNELVIRAFSTTELGEYIIYSDDEDDDEEQAPETTSNETIQKVQETLNEMMKAK